MIDPARQRFSLSFVAPTSDVDALGHISNIAYVRWVQEVATAHSEHVGFAHADYTKLGAIFVVRRHDIEYLRSAFAGDAITLHTHIESWRGARCERHTRIERDGDGALLVKAVTEWAFVSGATGRPTRIPVALQQAFGFA
jgi:acyl-CoA thioester hydrolase